MLHHHYHQPPERGGLLASLITLGAAAFVAYCLPYAWLDHAQPAPTLQMRPAFALELDALADDCLADDAVALSDWF